MNDQRGMVAVFRPLADSVLASVLGPVLFMGLVCLPGCVTRPENFETGAAVALVKELQIIPEFPDRDPDDIYKDARENIQTPIGVYARFVDEHQQPVAGLTIQMVVMDRLLDPFEYPYYGWRDLPAIATDKNGALAVQTTGAAIRVKIDSEHYWNEEGMNGLFYYAEEFRELNTLPLPDDPANPPVVILESRPPEAHTQLVSTGAILLQDGIDTPVAITGQQRYPSADGELRICLRTDRGSGAEPSTPYDWSVDITAAPGGGVQWVKQLPDIHAPASGYRKQLSFSMTASDPAWDHRKNLYLYVQTPERHYAMIELRVRTRGTPFVALEGHYNPHDSNVVR